MKEQYRRMISEIAPKRSDEELYNAVVRKAEIKMDKRKINKKAVIIPAAAVLAVTMGAAGVASFGGIEYLTGTIFGRNESIASEIKSSFYEDSNEHITMTVEEYITDGQSAYLTVRYTALDEEGKQWLDYKEFTHENLKIYPEVPSTLGYGCSELEEYRTETERYFYVRYEASTNESEQTEFTYPMFGAEVKSATFSLENNVESKMFKLVGGASPTEHYVPKYMSISELSYSIYGDNNGIYKDERDQNGWRLYSLLTEEESKELTDLTMDLIMANGSKIELEWHTALGSISPMESNGYTDLLIESGSNVKAVPNNDGGFDYIFEYIDPDEVVGLEIGDCYYELIEE